MHNIITSYHQAAFSQEVPCLLSIFASHLYQNNYDGYAQWTVEIKNSR